MLDKRLRDIVQDEHSVFGPAFWICSLSMAVFNRFVHWHRKWLIITRSNPILATDWFLMVEPQRSREFYATVYIHTYIHNWPIQPFSHDYGLASYITHVHALLPYVSGGTYSLTSTPNARFFEKLFHANFFYILWVFVRNLLRGNRRRKKFDFLFRFDAWPGFTSNKLAKKSCLKNLSFGVDFKL